jgi:hypothetical protein
MRWLYLLSLAAMSAHAGLNPQLEHVQTIYILPMNGGMDQFLANRLTQYGKFQVVANPKNADAVLTDHLGTTFEMKMDDLYASDLTPQPPPPKKPAKKPAAKDDKTTVDKTDKSDKADKSDKSDKSDDSDDSSTSSEIKGDTKPPVSTWSHGKGTFFIVDRKSRNVLWSVYERSRNTTAPELNKTAERVVNRLKHDLQPQSTN